MANSITTQVIEDGPRNQVEKYVIYVDTADYSLVTLTDSTLWNYPPTTQPKIKKIQYSCEDGMAVELRWSGATNSWIVGLNGRGKFDYDPPSPDDAVTPDGKVLLSTQGWVSGGGAGNAGIWVHTLEVHYLK